MAKLLPTGLLPAGVRLRRSVALPPLKWWSWRPENIKSPNHSAKRSLSLWLAYWSVLHQLNGVADLSCYQMNMSPGGQKVVRDVFSQLIAIT